VVLRDADLTGADLFIADLRAGQVAAADRSAGYRTLNHARGAADATGANLTGADLQSTFMTGLVAGNADFTGAVMKDCKLVRAVLKNANLSGADLAGADLSGANLSGATLNNAVLVGTRTYGWIIDGAMMDGVLTDAPCGLSARDLPVRQMLAAHARWCETGGTRGPTVALRRGRSPRTAIHSRLQSDGPVRRGEQPSTGWTWRA
jgi:uncharacterized protein YjbI with pentapeptide repeats